MRRPILSVLKILEDFSSPPKNCHSDYALTVSKDQLTRSCNKQETLWTLLHWVIQVTDPQALDIYQSKMHRPAQPQRHGVVLV